MLRHSALIFLCLGTFLATASWVRKSVPKPRGYAHFTEFFESKDEYDVVFLGTSYVRHGVIPETVDKLTGLRSYNLALNGAPGHELKQALDWVLDGEPRQLKLIVIQLTAWVSYPSGNIRSYRNTYWHTPRATFATIRSIVISPFNSLEKRKLIGIHLVSGAKRFTNVGLLHYLIKPRNVKPHSRGYAALYPLRPDGIVAKGRDSFLREFAEYEKGLENLGRAGDRIWMGSYDFQALESLKTSALKAGVDLLFLIPPTAGKTDLERWLGQNGYSVPMLDYNRPTLFPELFARDARWDRWHLNDDGAELFSTLLGKDIAALREGISD